MVNQTGTHNLDPLKRRSLFHDLLLLKNGPSMLRHAANCEVFGIRNPANFDDIERRIGSFGLPGFRGAEKRQYQIGEEPVLFDNPDAAEGALIETYQDNPVVAEAVKASKSDIRIAYDDLLADEQRRRFLPAAFDPKRNAQVKAMNAVLGGRMLRRHLGILVPDNATTGAVEAAGVYACVPDGNFLRDIAEVVSTYIGGGFEAMLPPSDPLLSVAAVLLLGAAGAQSCFGRVPADYTIECARQRASFCDERIDYVHGR